MPTASFESKIVNILIIGNGFDLDHSLPTMYMDFLNFIKGILYIKDHKASTKDEIKKSLEYLKIKEYVQNYLIENIYDDSERDIVKELVDLSKDNSWLDYFLKKKGNLNKGWIDFESEISEVIKSLEVMKSWVLEREVQGNNNLKVTDKVLEKIYTEFLQISKIGYDYRIKSEKYDSTIIDPLKQDLNNLIRCLEIYIDDCINNMPIKYKSPDIDDKVFHKVLSFNYSNTYERIYGQALEERYDFKVLYDYIHGKADISKSIEKNNMVLGIDEYLNDDEKDSKIDFIHFKKYYQRMLKMSSCLYKNWLEEKETYEEDGDFGFFSTRPIEVYIFGHSLDVTDKDILRDILLSENVEKVTIYYYDDNNVTYAKQLANLVKVIGQEKLQELFFEPNKKIFFEKQKKAIKISE